MQKLSYACCILLMIVFIACNERKSASISKQPEAVVTQGVSGDTVITYYYGVSPYRFNQHVNTQIEFVRNIKDTTGRFYLTEVYMNKKDSVVQRYEGAGNYKVLPKPNGEIQGVALYNMVLDDKSKNYIYLLKDSVTMVKVDNAGHEVKGEDAVTLKPSDKKYI